jgi:hypothetical protein
MNLDLELPDGTRISAEQSIRDPLPLRDQTVLWELDPALVRFVED